MIEYMNIILKKPNNIRINKGNKTKSLNNLTLTDLFFQ